MPFATTNPPHLLPEIASHIVTLPAVLPNDAATLKNLLLTQHKAYTSTLELAIANAVEKAVAIAVAAAVAATKLEAKAEMQRMIEQIVLARHRQFGVSSEHIFGQAICV